MSIEVVGPDGVVIEFPEGTSRETIKAALARRYPKSAGTKPKRKVSRTEAFVRGVERGLKPIGEFAEAINPLSYIVPIRKPRGAENRMAREAAEAQRQRPGFYTGGQIAGEVIGTAPFVAAGGVGLQATGRALAAAPKLRKAGQVVEQFGKAVTRGGAGVRAPTAANIARGAPVAATRKGRIALRAAGGAGAGVTAGALTDQDLSDAAIAGAAVPVFGHMAKFGAGKTFDMLAGRLGEVRAAEILRSLIEQNPTKIEKALRNAPKKIKANTAEFLASRGLLTPNLAAATRIASASQQSQELLEVAQRRAAGQNRMREIIRGGETQTAAVTGIGETKRALQDVTGPMREGALSAADVGRTQIIPLEREAARLRQLASEEAANARRLLTANARSADLIRESGLRLPADIKRQREIVAGLERFGGEAADRSLMAGSGARAAEAAAANLRAQGLQPLDISGLVSTLRQKASDAEFVSPDRFRILSEFANNIERRAAKMGGVIDATGLYLARREMGNFVSSILNTSDPKALRQGTAQLIGEAQPLIDDAIEAAGGKGWREYLTTFAEGMKGIERQELQRELMKLPEARIANVMAGRDPDFVESVLGPGRFDINVELEGPVLATAEKLGRDISAQRAVAQTGLEDLSPSQRLGFAQGARSAVAGELEPTVPNLMTAATRVTGGLPGVYGGGIAAEQASVKAAERASQNVMRNLVPALASPSRAGALLRVRPAEEYINRFLYGSRMPAMAERQQYLAQAARQAAMNPTFYDFPEVDPETGQILQGVGVNDDGSRYPIYGPARR